LTRRKQKTTVKEQRTLSRKEARLCAPGKRNIWVRSAAAVRAPRDAGTTQTSQKNGLTSSPAGKYRNEADWNREKVTTEESGRRRVGKIGASKMQFKWQ